MSQRRIELSDIGDVVEPLLTIMVSRDRSEWIAFTPQGYYDASPRGDRLIGWQVNQGRDRAARFCYADQFGKTFYRPDIIDRIWQTANVSEAVAQANMGILPTPMPTDIRVDIGKLEPPVVRILRPQDKITVEDGEIEVAAEIASPSGEAIREICVLVNDRPNLERNLEVAKGNDGGPAGTTEFKKVVQLSPGENRIVVIAKSKSNQTSNQIVVNRRVPPAVSKPRLHVVAVGVSVYQDDKLNLQFAAKDAVDFVAAMAAQRQRGRFSEEGVSITLVNKDANTKTILRELEQLHTQVSEGDLLVMLLAGHGIHDKQRNYFFATHDAETSSPNASCVSWAQLRLLIDAFPCRTVLFVDTCHGGGAFGGQRSLIDPFKLMAADGGPVLIAACKFHETSVELNGNGVLTQSLINTLNESRSDMVPKDSVLSLNELQFNIDWRVKALVGKQQTPVFYSGGPIANEPLFALPAN